MEPAHRAELILPTEDNPGPSVMGMALMQEVLEKVTHFVRGLSGIRNPLESTCGVPASELFRDHAECPWLENCISIQENQKVAFCLFGTEVSGWAETAFLEFVELIAFISDDIG